MDNHELTRTPSELVAAFYNVVDRRPFDRSAVDAFFGLKFRDHNRPPAPPEVLDREVAVALFVELSSGFTDGRHEVLELANVDGDRAFVIWRFTGTNDGTFFGAAPSGRRVDIQGMDFFTVSDGTFVAQRHIEQLAKLRAQLIEP